MPLQLLRASAREESGAFTASSPPVTLSQARDAPFSSRVTLKTLAPNSPASWTGSVQRRSASKSASAPSALSAEPKQQGKSSRRLTAEAICASVGFPPPATVSSSSSLHSARSSRELGSERSMQPEPKRRLSSAMRANLSAPARSILFTKMNTGTP